MAAVLLVENDAPMVRLLAWYLLEAGFEVAKAEGPFAVEADVRARPATVVVFNTGIPSAERAAFIRRWHGVSRDCRVLDVLQSVTARLTTDVGADASIQLPFDADTFIDLVKKLFDETRSDGSRAVDPDPRP